jgi:hypothetical protein
MKNLTFVGIVVNAVGSLVLVFTPLRAGYGGPITPAYGLLWNIGWGLMLIGFLLQAITAYHRH